MSLFSWFRKKPLVIPPGFVSYEYRVYRSRYGDYHGEWRADKETEAWIDVSRLHFCATLKEAEQACHNHAMNRLNYAIKASQAGVVKMLGKLP